MALGSTTYGGNIGIPNIAGTEMMYSTLTAAGWTLGTDTGGWDITAGVLSKTANATLTLTATALTNGSGEIISPTVGVTYKVVIVASAVSGTISYTFGGVAGTSLTTATTITDYITPTTTANIILSGINTDTCTITSINIKEVHTAQYFNNLQDATTNYERFYMKWNTNVFTIGTEFSGSGNARDLQFHPATGNSYFYTKDDGVGNYQRLKIYYYPDEGSSALTPEGAGTEPHAPHLTFELLSTSSLFIFNPGTDNSINLGDKGFYPNDVLNTRDLGVFGGTWRDLLLSRDAYINNAIRGGLNLRTLDESRLTYTLLATVGGTPGTNNYGYKVGLITATGETIATAQVLVTTGNANLSGTNYISIDAGENSNALWADGVKSINLYRTFSNGTPSSIGLIANVIFDDRYDIRDIGQAADITQQPKTQDTTQTFYSYNADDGVGNYERAALKWDSNIFNITTEHGGTGNTRTLTITSDLHMFLNVSNGGAFFFVRNGVQQMIWDGSQLYPSSAVSFHLGLNSNNSTVNNIYQQGNIYSYNGTDFTNYERFFSGWISSVYEMRTEIGGSGTLRDMALLPGSGKLGINTSTPGYATDIKAASSTGTITFTSGGGAVNDMTKSGTFIGSTSEVFCVQIDGSDTPDTFKWGVDNCSTWIATLVPISGGAQLLQEGVSITFGSTNTHTVTDKWTFTTTVVNPLNVANAAGTSIITALNNIKVGINTNTPNSTFHVNGSQAGNVTTYNTSDTVLATDYYVICNSATPMTMTLVTSVGIKGRSYIFKNINTGTCTIAGYGGTETIDGITSQTIVTNAALSIFSDNANWWIF
jgi:hypothetical protein